MSALKIIANPGQCGCGCKEAVKGKTARFRPGHDARLRGELLRAHAAGRPVALTTGGETATIQAAEYAALAFSPVGLASWTRSAEKAAR